MTDLIIEKILNGEINTNNISYELLRAFAGRDLNCWDTLGRGRSILSSVEQLDQYLYSYGPMTQNQWAYFLPSVFVPCEPVCLIDYGCGQGLGSAIVFDFFGKKFVSQIQQMILIEPSQIALTRAKCIAECYSPNSSISLVTKNLDSLSVADIQKCRGLHRIHIFSNVLDIDGFDIGTLFNKIFSYQGHHTVLAVSHDRSFGGGSDRFHDFEKQINDEKHRGWYLLQSSEITNFQTQNSQDAISWKIQLEVLDGTV